jgi:hypothetical protein
MRWQVQIPFCVRLHSRGRDYLLPIPEKDDNSAANDKDDPDENIRQQPSRGPMNMECHSSIMQNVNEQHSQRQSCNRGFNEEESRNICTIWTIELMSETQIHSEYIEEVEDKEDFSNDKVFMHLSN